MFRKTLVVSFALTVLSLVFSGPFSGPALAQGWAEYINQEERFGINFPGEPESVASSFEMPSGASYPANIYHTEDSAGRYVLTVVNYEGANRDEIETILDDAIDVMRGSGGDVTYDEVAVYDGMETQMMQFANADQSRRFVALIHPPPSARLHRLYIVEGHAAANLPIPGHFQQSLFIVDLMGERVRYSTDIEGNKFRVQPNTGGMPLLAPECAPGLPCLAYE
jgi:hypothetical protein